MENSICASFIMWAVNYAVSVLRNIKIKLGERNVFEFNDVNKNNIFTVHSNKQ